MEAVVARARRGKERLIRAELPTTRFCGPSLSVRVLWWSRSPICTFGWFARSCRWFRHFLEAAETSWPVVIAMGQAVASG